MSDLWWRVPIFMGGVFLVLATVLAAVRSFVLPRSEAVRINKWALTLVRYLFDTVAVFGKTYAQRDRVMALFAPVGLVMLPLICLGLVSAGYTAIYWALGSGSLTRCYKLSSSSLLTLGTDESRSLVVSAFSYSEAALGLLLITLLISYIPTMYQAFARREAVVSQLELRAGNNRSAIDLVCWLGRSHSLDDDQKEWDQWAAWFVELEASHTSLPMLTFFRSPQPGRSWVTAANIILDTAALILSGVDQTSNRYTQLCFRAGCMSLNRIMRYFHDHSHTRVSFWRREKNAIVDPDPAAYAAALEQLAAQGIPIVVDQDAAWEKYQELRTHYFDAVDYLARLTSSPHLQALYVEPSVADEKEAQQAIETAAAHDQKISLA
ncbi:hypothetical protein F1C16_18570 [Hymenobacter sp. NBH84]|uniref:hypothetical protein n=1 Tax=Hymenobacter sp. NBH84 TaxID=2596915 RepID=UPI0016261055|nr:hypothetical protein [Hymenobacter sp. NBH84]QNE41420.1 hypothetical protein F1C16_18570 [Hymenobacter sp. NBH84]